ncbi:pyridoxal phosphate-dependent acyltransferase, partial [mine drainage metagenome]
MGTFSKAIGAMGGFVAGDEDLMRLMKQRSRPFLFSSALDPPEVGAVLKAIEIMERDDTLLKKLWHNASLLKSELSKIGFSTGNSKTPITPVMIGKEKDTLDLSRILYEEHSVFASPIVYPTVAQGTSRIRLMPS